VGPHFAAVIDGATPKSKRDWGGETRGRLVSRLLTDALARMPRTVDAFGAVDRLSAAIREGYARFDATELVRDDPNERLTASVAIFSAHTRAVWLIGDCHALIGSRHVSGRKQVDELLAAARAAYLEIEIARGVRPDALRDDDPGRQFIAPLLERQAILQNAPDAGPLWYPVLDGFAVPREGIFVVPVPADVTSVVLASDGYPFLCETLAESEARLMRALEADPLCIRELRSTKGVAPGSASFDDRAFVRITV
jgi:glycerophosphoryl diester phosphodiesterase